MTFRQLRLKARVMFSRRDFDRDLEDEIRLHMDLRENSHVASGMHSENAAAASRISFGNVVNHKENIRDMWSFVFVESVWRDILYAVRSLRRSPAFSIAAVAVLALGIGSTIAIFSLVDATLLRGLPFKEPERLAVLWGNVQRQKVERRGNSYPDYLDWKKQTQSVESMAAYSDGWVTVKSGEQAERFPSEWVSAGYFEVLGLTPAAGRTFRSDEDRPGSPSKVAMMSEGLAQRRFGGSAQTIGQQIRLNDSLYTVIGIAPRGFHGLTDSAEIWCPFTASLSNGDLMDRGSRGFPAVARLKTHASLSFAQTELDAISRRLEAAYPDTNKKRGVEVAPLSQELTGDLRTPLLVLLGAVGFVLLIACANVANLLLARSETRRQEIAIRASMGAGKIRIVRQLICEALVLSATGSAAGFLLGAWAIRLLIHVSPVKLPTFVDAQPNAGLAIFAIGLSVLVAVVVGIVPALHLAKNNLSDVLKKSSSRSGNLIGQRLRGALVVAEVALSVALLIGSGLLIRSFQQVTTLNTGFDSRNVLTLMVALPRAEEQKGESSIITGRMLMAKLRAIPSVTAVSVSSDVPLSGESNAVFYAPEGQAPMDAQTRPRAYVHRVSPGYFTALGTPLIAGRSFTDAEIERKASAIMVTRNLVQRFWPGQDGIGKRIKIGSLDAKGPWLEIVGVVSELKYRGVPDNPTADPDIFFPFADRQRNVAILLRSSTGVSNLIGDVRSVVRSVDASIPIYEVAPMTERVGRSVQLYRFAGWLMTVFAGLALVLTVTGLYGVIGYTVRQRTREFGIRIAIGASAAKVTAEVIRDGMVLAGIGAVAGALASIGLARIIRSLLFGVSPTDPITFVGVLAVLGFSTLAACYLPARRAARTNPAVALRYE